MDIRIATSEDAAAISQLLQQLSRQFIAPDFSAEGMALLLNAMSETAILGYLQQGYHYQLAELPEADPVVQVRGQQPAPPTASAGKKPPEKTQIRKRIIGVVAMRDLGHLYHLFVAPTAQHSGVATLLWQAALRQSLARRTAQATSPAPAATLPETTAANPPIAVHADFTVNSSLFAQGFYQKLGFVAMGPQRQRGGVIDQPMQLAFAKALQLALAPTVPIKTALAATPDTALRQATQSQPAPPLIAATTTAIMAMPADLVIRAATAADAGAIVAIYNPYIAQTEISFETEAVSAAEMAERIAKVQAQALPWLVLEQAGQIMGYAYATPWRVRAAYRYSVESSVYLAQSARGRGFGRILYQQLLHQLALLPVHLVIGGVTLPNDASVRLHQQLGFQWVGQFNEVGYKHQGWRDVGYWQLHLPLQPAL